VCYSEASSICKPKCGERVCQTGESCVADQCKPNCGLTGAPCGPGSLCSGGSCQATCGSTGKLCPAGSTCNGTGCEVACGPKKCNIDIDLQLNIANVCLVAGVGAFTTYTCLGA
jgi:hypothetical protein